MLLNAWAAQSALLRLLHPKSQISPEHMRGHSSIGQSITPPSFGDDSAIETTT
jgi:hypothetical protein